MSLPTFRAFFESACAAQDAAKGSWNVGDHAREWFGSTVAYVQTMAARPCVQPGKDCGFCDSCEARLDVAHLRARAEEASRG